MDLVLPAFAFLSGIVTILSPCILPVLPILLSGSVGNGRARPFGIVAGFVLGFTFFTLALSALVSALGIPSDALRIAAVVFVAGFGLVMILPSAQARFERLAAGLANFGGGRGRAGARPRPSEAAAATEVESRLRPASVDRGAAAAAAPAGFWGGIPVGLSLGLLWTPCVGPIMASVIGLAATRGADSASALIALAYSLGTAVPMLAVMAGGRTLLAKVPALARNAGRVQRGFGVVMVLAALSIGLGWDRRFQTAVLAAFPGYGAGLSSLESAAPVKKALAARSSATGSASGGTFAARDSGPGAALDPARPGQPLDALRAAIRDRVFAGVEEPLGGGALSDYGAAPPLVAGGPWLNGPPLDMKSLRGKVVVIDFWTYSCVNCIRTIPYLRAWYDAYKDRGLVLIGVHSPEFEFEKSAANVAAAMKDLGVTWPVVQDNDYKQWLAYSNRYWPAHYFIDAKGRVRYVHYGEGEYETGAGVIRALLAETGSRVVGSGGYAAGPEPELATLTPEIYLGYERGRNFASAVAPVADAVASYKPSRAPDNGEWNLEGRWRITAESVEPETSGALELGFIAKDVFLVAAPRAEGGSIRVLLDGRVPRDTADLKGGILTPSASRLYRLVGLDGQEAHRLRLEVAGKLRLYAFTFG